MVHNKDSPMIGCKLLSTVSLRSCMPTLRIIFSFVSSQESGGEEEALGALVPVKSSPKPRRAKLLAKGRKLGNRKRGRPKKSIIAAATERKTKKSQSALDLLHAKTVSAAPPQGTFTSVHSHVLSVSAAVLLWARLILPCCFLTDAYKSPQSPYYQLPPKVQHYTAGQLLLGSMPAGLQTLLGKKKQKNFSLWLYAPNFFCTKQKWPKL